MHAKRRRVKKTQELVGERHVALDDGFDLAEVEIRLARSIQQAEVVGEHRRNLAQRQDRRLRKEVALEERAAHLPSRVELIARLHLLREEFDLLPELLYQLSAIVQGHRPEI